jgi:uncharacterized protein (UPF0332 family)
MADEVLIRKRIKTAQRRLEVARLLHDRGFINDALSKSYYAIFAAAKALLASEGLQSKKHSGVISLFNKHFVKAGLVSKQFSKIIKQARDERELSDYDDFFEAGQDETADQIKDAESFINMAISFLQTRGFKIPS